MFGALYGKYRNSLTEYVTLTLQYYYSTYTYTPQAFWIFIGNQAGNP